MAEHNSKSTRSVYHLTEPELPANTDFLYDLEVSSAYKESSPTKKRRRPPKTENHRQSRRGAIFKNIFDDDADGGVFYDLSTPRSSVNSLYDEEELGAHELCRQRYLKACRQLNITPLSRLVGQLHEGWEVDLSNHKLGSKELNAVCSALVEHASIKRLNLSDNEISGNMVSYVAQLVTKNPFITDLILKDNKLSGNGIRLVGKMLKGSNTIKVLDVSGNSLNDNDGACIADIIKETPGLLSLRLSHNQFRLKGGLYLGEALSKNKTLDRLDISWNHLRGRGAEAVANGILKNKTLSILDVSWNGFGFEGCVAMGHALYHNKTLRHLNMESNRIHPPALFELSKGVIANRGLQTLKIGKNPITALCTSPFLSVISDNCEEITLTVLDMSSVVVDEDFEDILGELVKKRPIQVYYERCLAANKNKWRAVQEGKAPQMVFNIDPVQILFHMKKNLRNIDLFRLFDCDNSASLTKDEIAVALERFGYPMSSTGMDQIMAYLDEDGNGEVDLMEFINGQRKFTRKRLTELGPYRYGDMENIEDAQMTGTDHSATFRPDLAKNSKQLTNSTTNRTKQRPPRQENVKLPKI